MGPMKGRSVARAFAHLHNVRLMWIRSAAPELPEGLETLRSNGAEDDPDRTRGWHFEGEGEKRNPRTAPIGGRPGIRLRGPVQLPR